MGARWLTGQEHATETAKRRWWDTLAAMRWLTVQVNPKTYRWLGMFDVDPRTSGDVWIGPPAWWKESRAESGPRSWRLSGGLWRPPLIGDTPAQGTAAGYWGTLARTVDGIEAALTWGRRLAEARAGGSRTISSVLVLTGARQPADLHCKMCVTSRVTHILQTAS